MGVKSPKLDFDLNSNFALVNISDFLAYLSMINDASKKLTKLNDYIHELEVELIKMDSLKRELPLCMLLTVEGIERLKEERMRTKAEARLSTREFSPLKDGDDFNEDLGAKKSNNCGDEMNGMSSAKLWTTNVQYANFDMRKQNLTSNLKSDVKQENGSASKNSYDQIRGKLKKSEGFSGPFQRQSSLIIREKNNVSPIIALPASVSRTNLGPIAMSLKQNTSRTSTDLAASVSRVELDPIDMNLKQNPSKTSTSLLAPVPSTELCRKQNTNKIGSTSLPTSVPGAELGSIDMTLKRNSSQTSTGSSLTTNSGKKPRLCWSPEFHKAFINTVQRLGDPNASTSSEIPENMQQVAGLCNNEVKSNLQPNSAVRHSEAFHETQSREFVNKKRNLLVANARCSSVPRAEKGNVTETSSVSSLIADLDKKPRRCWSNELHRIFVNALQHLGGPYVATPKQIRERMQVDDLTNDEVKSHLQKYRLHLRKSPERSTASSSYIWPGRGCRHGNMSKGSTSHSVSGSLNVNGSAKEVSTSGGGTSNAPKNTTGGQDNAPKDITGGKKFRGHN